MVYRLGNLTIARPLKHSNEVNNMTEYYGTAAQEYEQEMLHREHHEYMARIDADIDGGWCEDCDFEETVWYTAKRARNYFWNHQDSDWYERRCDDAAASECAAEKAQCAALGHGIPANWYETEALTATSISRG